MIVANFMDVTQQLFESKIITNSVDSYILFKTFAVHLRFGKLSAFWQELMMGVILA